jgi:hypothetical protein
MATEQTIQQELQDYMDGLCSPEKAAEIENKLAMHPEWLKEFEAFTDLETLLKSPGQMMEPSVRFTKNVMESIEGLHVAKPASAYLNKWIFYAIAGLLGAALLAIFGISIAQMDWGTTTETPTTFQVPSFHWQGLYSSKVLQVAIMANIILGFVLIEKAVSKRNQRKHA